MMGGATVGWMWAWPVLVVAGLLTLAYVGDQTCAERTGAFSDRG
jgi:hypothetical protein